MFAEQGFELRKGHLYRIEVGRIGGQEKEPGATCCDDFFDLRTFVEGDVIEDHDIARCQRWRELSFDVDREDLGVHRRINEPRCRQAIVAQPGNKSLCLPRAERRIRVVALTARRPASALGQLGVGRCFIDEHQLMGALAKERHAPMDPEVTGLGDIKPVPFAGCQAFFYG